MDDDIIDTPKGTPEVNAIQSRTPNAHPDGQRRRRQRQQRDEAGDHFESLTRAVERAHTVLEEKKSPYRFCVYRSEGEVFIDIVILDENGNPQSTVKKNITHEKFTQMMSYIERGGGLFFDRTL